MPVPANKLIFLMEEEPMLSIPHSGNELYWTSHKELLIQELLLIEVLWESMDDINGVLQGRRFVIMTPIYGLNYDFAVILQLLERKYGREIGGGL